MKLFHATCCEAGVFKWALFLGKARPLKLGRAKTSKIQRDLQVAQYYFVFRSCCILVHV